ncbi:MAG TPA: type II toxin-antitoxin system VapC family toxin [Nevskiales bacterium]|nr:type II toxin-antitoxin system VapC family toxin [Nevskiales bacterium]
MKTSVVCDTHALIYWSLAPKRLGAGASKSIEQARKQGEIFCADISLWEIARLVEKGRLELGVAAEAYLDNLVTALGLTALPVSPRIAALAQSGRFQQKDPADRLIGATALALNAPLVIRDASFSQVAGLRLLWS